ncbi:MAG: hypothetical protein ACYDAS_04395 [Patescibacteria group bacterium]
MIEQEPTKNTEILELNKVEQELNAQMRGFNSRLHARIEAVDMGIVECQYVYSDEADSVLPTETKIFINPETDEILRIDYIGDTLKVTVWFNSKTRRNSSIVQFKNPIITLFLPDEDRDFVSYLPLGNKFVKTIIPKK